MKISIIKLDVPFTNGILNNLNIDYWKSLFSIGFSYDESIKDILY